MYFSHVMELFPTPVLFSQYPQDFSEEEQRFFKNVEWTRNISNSKSKDTYILHRPELSVIKTTIESLLNSYIQEILEPRNEVTAYVTQSWLNKTEQGQSHHMHNHPNSFLSGVLYLSTNKDTITFTQQDRKLFALVPKCTTNLNAENCSFSPAMKDIIIFPSYLHHQIEPKRTEGTRLSLAFNSLLHGAIGDATLATEACL